MKKFLLLANVMLILALSLNAQKNWIGYTTDNQQLPQITIEEQSDSRVVINVDINGMYVTNIENEKGEFQQIELIYFLLQVV